MTDEVADHRAVLLLNPGLVVLAVRPGTGELDAPLGAVLGDGFVDEYAVIARTDVRSRLALALRFSGTSTPVICRPAPCCGLLPVARSLRS